MDLEKLFQACQITSNAHLHPQNVKREAEDYLMSFQKSPRPYELCFKILQFSNDENKSAFLQFHFLATSTLREALLREWSQLEFNTIEQVSNFSFEILPNLDRVIQKQIVRLLSIVAKREQAINNTTKILDRLYNVGLNEEFFKKMSFFFDTLLFTIYNLK